MTILIPPAFGLLAARMTLTGDPEPIICTFGVGTFADASDAQDAVNAFATAWGDEIMDVVCSTYTFLGAELRYLLQGQPATDPASVVLSPSVNVAGKNTSAAVPQNTAYLIHKRTGIAGRQFRGRTYLPGVGEPSVSATGQVTGDLVTDIPAKFAAMLTAMTTAGFGLRLLHAPPKEGTTPTPTLINSFQLDPVVATQRRRLRR